MPWLEELEIVVHIDRDLDLWASARMPGGSTVAELKAALLCRDSAGEVLRGERFGLRRPGGAEVADELALTQELRELEVYDLEEEPSSNLVTEPPVPVEPDPTGETDAAGEPQTAEAKAPAGITLRTLSGREEVLHDLRPEDTLLVLAERAAEVLNLPVRELSFCFGGQALRIRELHEPLSKLGIGPGAELTVVRQAVSSGANVVEYRVLQGPLFKKPGEDPAGERIISLTRAVTSRIRTTGRTWTGPSGGQWVEVDCWAERPGWLLVQGPGFDRHGPLLEVVTEGEEEPISLSVMSPVFNDGTRLKAKENHLCDICVRPSETLGHVKSVIATQCPDYKAHKLQLLTLEEFFFLSNDNRRHDFTENDMLVSSLKKQHGDTLTLIVFK